MNNYDYFFKNLVSLPNIQNNLLILKIDSCNLINYYVYIKDNSFDYINSLKSLEELSLRYFNFEYAFKLKLFNLKKLKLIKCDNISLDESIPFNLKKLKIYMGIINKSDSLIKFPKLEKCFLFRNFNYSQEEYDKIIDFESLINLKKLTMEFKEFKFIKNKYYLKSLEDLRLKYVHLIDEEYINQILLFKKLKYLDMKINKIDFSEIKKIKTKNNSLSEINIEWNEDTDCQFAFLQEKFPNLIKCNITSTVNKNKNIIIEIKQNNFSKVNTINISGALNNLYINCANYENLKEIKIFSKNKIKNIIDNSFPIFCENSKIIFKSLKIFVFDYHENYVDLKLLINIYNNLDNMPILKYFELKVISKDINEEFHKKLIRKLLSLNLDTCILRIKKKLLVSFEENIFNKNELKDIFPKMKDVCFYDKIYIEKIEKDTNNNLDNFEFEFI